MSAGSASWQLGGHRGAHYGPVPDRVAAVDELVYGTYQRKRAHALVADLLSQPAGKPLCLNDPVRPVVVSRPDSRVERGSDANGVVEPGGRLVCR
jgi:hypothetical protein